MSVRIRKNGDIVCAALTEEEVGDTYIEDALHYEMSVVYKVIVTDNNHMKHTKWWWANNVPEGVEINKWWEN